MQTDPSAGTFRHDQEGDGLTLLGTQPNFRDLGGIQTADGRRVKHGLLFRSGDLFSVSDEDIRKLESLGLSMIIDLRAGREIEHRPDRKISTVREIVHIDIHDAARDKAEQFLAENDAEGLETVLIGDYRRMVNLHQTDFKKFLDILAITENLPLVYHCAAGKDRTGMTTLFLLHALGADPDVIWQDYLETNIRTADFVEKIIKKVNESGQNGSILRPLLEVRREYLQSALDEMDLHYGGLDHYVRNILEANVDRLRERYLE